MWEFAAFSVSLSAECRIHKASRGFTRLIVRSVCPRVDDRSRGFSLQNLDKYPDTTCIHLQPIGVGDVTGQYKLILCSFCSLFGKTSSRPAAGNSDGLENELQDWSVSSRVAAGGPLLRHAADTRCSRCSRCSRDSLEGSHGGGGRLGLERIWSRLSGAEGFQFYSDLSSLNLLAHHSPSCNSGTSWMMISFGSDLLAAIR